METRLHPLYKDVALKISSNYEIFYSDTELSELLEENLETKEYQFALMHLRDHLLDEYQIDFIRSENEQKGKGYKKASYRETLEISTEKQQRRMRNSVHRQRKQIDTIDRSALPGSYADLYDRKIIRNGMALSLVHIPLSKCLPGSTVRVDVPKMIK